MMQFNDSGKTSVADILKDNSKLTPDAVNAIVTDIMENKLSNTEIGAFLAAVKLLGKENDARVIFAAAEALRAASLKCGMTSKVIDIVGTGGDGQDTFNVSTAASIVASGTGCKVAKHGSRASSSSSGSADVLEALGAELDAVNPQTASYILQSSNFCFLFAPSFHPAMKNVAEARKELGVRTLFNILGPLVNPASPSRMVVGVSSSDLGRTMAAALQMEGVERGWVVHGTIGLDEISPQGTTMVWEFDANDINEFTVCPSDFGLAEHTLDKVVGGNASANAQVMRKLLDGELHGPILDFVLMNTAALLLVGGKASNLREGVSLARESISSGAAKKQLEAFIDITRK